MAELHVITALRAKRAELAGQIEATARYLAELRANLAHVDGALLVFDPDYRPREIVAKRLVECSTLFRQGEATRLVLDIVRGASEPMRNPEIVERIIARKGIENSRDIRVAVEKRVDRVLRRQEAKAVERVVVGPRAVGWSVAQ